MKGNFLRLSALAAIMTMAFTCGSKNISEAAENVSEAEDSENNCIEEMEAVVAAIEGASNQPSFRIDTDASLSLNGKSIKGDYHLKSEVHIAQEKEHENMQMSMKSSSDMDDVVTCAYYKDGWYYVDGADGKEKEEKTPEEVMEMISGVTDLVKESAEKIKTVDVTRDGSDTIYCYNLPSYLAEDYLENLLGLVEVDDLSGAKIRVDQAALKTRVDENGLLKTQTIQISGSVHKAIFTIPAEAEITADFQIPDEEAPEIETW